MLSIKQPRKELNFIHTITLLAMPINDFIHTTALLMYSNKCLLFTHKNMQKITNIQQKNLLF